MVKKGDITILMGDLNAQIGQCNLGREEIMGRHGLGVLSGNGELFTELWASNNLVIGGTLFNHKRIHKVTWTSPDHTTENQIDHIAISRKWRGSLTDVRNKRGADISSDHHLLIAVVRLKVAAITQQKSQRRFNVEKLKDERASTRFVEALTSTTAPTTPHENEWQRTKQVFLNSAETHLGFKAIKRKCWISDRTWNLINDRRDIKNQLNCAKTRLSKTVLQQRYSDMDKQVKKSARTDKRIWNDNIASNAQSAAETHRTRDLFLAIRNLTNKSQKSSKPFKDEHGEMTTPKTKQVRI
ncbi:uncharacterized protein LOC128860875 [Anastrepha ludens]|uniref:uncharacterized protein LOC128860875 n=1 Tax=Anastrepha ludens TaxID=28586 RepID=UPI0023AF8492|nr:uncharacterized protein LOC128860875 [Anastrepha ludens]